MCFATALFVCGVAGYPVAAGSPPPADGTIVLGSGGSTTVQPGQKIKISGNGFASRAAVTVSIYSAPTTLSHTTANKRGHMSTTIKIPSGLRGSHTLSAIGNGPGRTAHALETAVIVKKRSGTAVLPATGLGFNLALWAVGGMLLVVSGLILVRSAVMRRPLVP